MEPQHTTDQTTYIQCTEMPRNDKGDGVREHDVICGRDSRTHSHPGNKQFRHLVQMYRERYQSTKRRCEKSCMTKEIIRAVVENGGRFLRIDEESGSVMALNASETHEKVSHALRSAKARNVHKKTKSRKTQRKPKKKIQAPKVRSNEEDESFMKVLGRQKEILDGLCRAESLDSGFEGDDEDDDSSAISMLSDLSESGSLDNFFEKIEDEEKADTKHARSASRNGSSHEAKEEMAIEPLALTELTRSETMERFLTNLYPEPEIAKSQFLSG